MSNHKVGVGVGIMILKDNRILLGKRHEDPEKAASALHGEGCLTMPGGKVDFGETINQAALRETLEETGLKLNTLKLISLTDEILDDIHFVTNGFLCEDFEGIPQILEPDEITEWQWFDLNNLPEPLFPPCIKIVKNFKSKEIYKH
jgi:8-oxo-dGTP diphosphatase